jgi:hypothetical protein
LIKNGLHFPSNREDHGPALAKNTHSVKDHCQRESQVKKVNKTPG